MEYAKQAFHRRTSSDILATRVGSRASMDQRIFFLINRQWTSPALDRIMAAASSLDLWLPFLVALVLGVAWLGRRRARWMLVTLGLMLAVGDGLIAGPLKHLIHRPRPWQAMAGVRQVDLARHARPRVAALFEPLDITLSSTPQPGGPADTGAGRSFPSSHVVNNFCAAMVLTLFYRRWGWLYFLPATLVAYSRVYVGAHWPSDVFVSVWLALGVALLFLAGLQGAMRTVCAYAGRTRR